MHSLLSATYCIHFVSELCVYRNMFQKEVNFRVKMFTHRKIIKSDFYSDLKVIHIKLNLLWVL